MKPSLIVIVSVVLGCASLANTGEGESRDNLAQVDLSQFADYRKVWLAKLGKTHFDCGRVVVRPFGEPEFSISVYSQHMANGAKKYYVTRISADRSLYLVSDDGHHPGKAEGVKTRRIDAQIPAETAELLRQVWLRTIKNAKGKIPPPLEEWEVSPGDATDIEFSIELPNASPLYGQVNQWLDHQRPSVKGIIDLATMLKEFCDAKPNERLAIAKRIDGAARKFLALSH